MADTFSKEKRSAIMQKVKGSRNKSTELRMINFFQLHHIRGWRRNWKLFGKPDFVFPKNKIALFVDGCFWHGHDCRNTTPQSNKDYWEKKIFRNRERDKKVNSTLTKAGWKVIRIWECALSKKLPVKLKGLLQLSAQKEAGKQVIQNPPPQ